jgi:hypothetical protein
MLVLRVLAAGVLALALVSPCPVWAKPQTVVRVTAGEHPYFGRVVLNAPGLAYTVSRDGGHVLIRFSEDPILGELPPTPRNVLAIKAVSGGMELTVPPGANVHAMRIGDKVVVDIDDTVPNRTPPAALRDVHEAPKGDLTNPWAKHDETNSNPARSAAGQVRGGMVPGASETRSPRSAPPAKATPEDASRPNVPADHAPGGDTPTGHSVLAGAAPGSLASGNATSGDAAARDAAQGATVLGNAVPGNVLLGNAVLGKAMSRNAVPGNVLSGNAMLNNAAPASATPELSAASTTSPRIAASGRARGKVPRPPEARASPANPAPWERTTGTGIPDKVNSSAEAPTKRDAAASGRGQAGPDGAGSAGPASSAPNGPNGTPKPRAAETSGGAEALTIEEKPPGTAVIQPAPGQTTARPEGPQDGRPEGQPGGPREGQPDGRPEVRPDGAASAQPASAQPASAQVWPVTRDAAPPGPVALLAIKARPPAGLAGVAVRFPFTGAVGAALFSRGSDIFVVFDERRPIDLAALRDDPVFGSAVVALYPAATVIRLTRPPGQSAMLFPAQLGWRLSIVAASPMPAAFAQDTANGVMTFAAGAPGQVVGIADPRTGGTLIVGTQRISGQGVPIERRTPEFILPVTGQGIVIEPLSDAISLRITQAGFVLSGAPPGLALSPAQLMPEATMAAARLTRLFEFPRQTTEDLARRVKQQGRAAAMAPLLTRGPKRHALAESMLGLGLGAETQTLLRITMKDDPREAASPATIGLAAIAALLAGRPGEAGDLADPRLTGTDEIALWRAIQMAMADEGSPAAAAVFATTAPLLFTYPAELRRRVLPLALETMILGGEAGAAAPLLARREHDPGLAYARALLPQAQGDNDGALKLLDALTNSRSDFDHARAGVRAAELRLAMGQLDAKAAADALETRLSAWRGDRRDLALRLRIAELREQQGRWRSVFALLRGAKADFPAQAAEIDRRLQEVFAAVPRDPALGETEPTELIALLEENAELMADGPDGEPMRVLLAEKLMALDLPKRADPLLTKLMRAAPFGPARAGYGATLATLRLHEGDSDGAILALSESNSADMGDAVRGRRSLITARVEAKRGDTAGALETLSGDQTPEAAEARAAILEQAKDWPAARDALAVLAALVVPDRGMLSDAQLQVVLRLATAATRADDDATLTSLRETLRTRIGTGPQADMFRLLTAEPVRGTADLGRARMELGLTRAVTADMGPKPPAAKTP